MKQSPAPKESESVDSPHMWLFLACSFFVMTGILAYLSGVVECAELTVFGMRASESKLISTRTVTTTPGRFSSVDEYRAKFSYVDQQGTRHEIDRLVSFGFFEEWNSAPDLDTATGMLEDRQLQMIYLPYRPSVAVPGSDLLGMWRLSIFLALVLLVPVWFLTGVYSTIRWLSLATGLRLARRWDERIRGLFRAFVRRMRRTGRVLEILRRH